MRLVEQRAVFICDKIEDDDALVLTAQDFKNEALRLGMQIIDLQLLRNILLTCASEKSSEERLVPGSTCQACGMIHMHVKSCRAHESGRG